MKKIILPFCALLASAHPVFAEDDITQIIISATGKEESEVLAPVSLSVITPQEIKASGANTLTEVLRKQAGIQIKDKIGGGSRASVSLRGFGENSVNNVLIVVDGRKLNNPTLEAPLLSSISLKDIERIEVIQGSGGVLYGDQAVGGVINIITKKFQEDDLYISTTRGTDSLETYKAGGSQTFNNGIGYRISAEKKQTDSYRDNNESDYSNVFAEVGYDAGWGNINYERSYVDDKLNLPGSLSNVQVAENRRQTTRPSDFSNNRITIDSLQTSLFINEHIKLNTDISLRDSEGSISFGTPYKQDTKVRIFSTKIIGDWVASQGNINFIGGYEEIKNDYFSSNNFAGADIENIQQSVYTQLSYPIVSGLNIVAGARHTENDDRDFKDNKENEKSLTAKEVGLNYRTTIGRFFVRRAEAFRFANADENRSKLASVDFLKPQESVSYEVGYEYNKNNKLINVLIYDLAIDNEIFYDSNVGSFGLNVNLDKSKRQGILVELGTALNSTINIGGSLGYSKAELRAGSFVGNEVGGTARKSASAFVDYKLKHNINLYLDTIYTGSSFVSGDEANNQDKQPSYTLVNFSASWATGPLDLGFRVNNLTGEKYSAYINAFGDYPAPERTVEFTIAYDIF
jgi:iron complex outermembrane receptor protein